LEHACIFGTFEENSRTVGPIVHRMLDVAWKTILTISFVYE